MTGPKSDLNKSSTVDTHAQEGAREMRELADVFSPDAPVEQLQRAFDNVFFGWKRDWLVAFWLMLVMATGIATLGLSENSAAVVIGAMVVAPLGTPIIALGASVAIGWIRQIESPRIYRRLFGLSQAASADSFNWR